MLVSLPFRRFVQRLRWFLPQRRVSRRLRFRRSDFALPVPAIVETLEARVLLSSIVVNSLGGGQNYASTVTFAQLDPTRTAVTLRDAVNAANSTTGTDTISFDPNVFPANAATPTTITLTGGTPLELKDTTGATTIAGSGAGEVAVSGGNLSTVFLVDSGVTAAIDGLTITGGHASVNFGGQGAGGGIYNHGALTLQNDVITNNSAAGDGGGLFNDNFATANLIGTTLSSNAAQNGGGFFNTGNVTVSGSTLTANTVTSNGGGFYNQSTVTVTNSTLSSNSAANWGGGFFSNNSVILTGSTLNNNSAGGFGGGFFNSLNATLTESTLASNTAQDGGGFANFSNVTVNESTIASNSATSAGGGIYNVGSNVSLAGTILAHNTLTPSAVSSDWAGSAASAASTYNLIGDGTNSGLVNGTNHNIVGTSANPLDPHLAALANNGGPTQTMALQAGSAAINAGSNALVAGLTTDQRGAGFNRIAGVTVDIGAFEIQSHPPAPPAVNGLLTNSGTPVLTGTWDDKNANVLQVTVNGTTFTLGSDPQLAHSAAGQWTLTTSTKIPDGTYTVIIHTQNEIGEATDDTAASALTIDTVPPAAPTFNALLTNNNLHLLTGTWDQTSPGGATVLQVTVAGLTFTLGSSPQLTSDGSGHWTLAPTSAIPDGTYSVIVHTADAAGNVSNLTASNALTVDTVAPAAPTFKATITNNVQPVLTGTWDQGTPGGATTLQVTVNGATYTLGSNPQLTSDGAGHWSLATPAVIPDGTYSVSIHSADAAGNVSNFTATNALTIDSQAPATPTFNTQITNNNHPVLSGTWDEGTPGGAVALQVTVAGTTFTLGTSPQLTSDGAGHWTLATTATVPDGTYNVVVHTADAAGNISNFTASNALTVDTVAPAAPTVNGLLTNNSLPVLTGTWDQTTPGGATALQVTVNGTTFTLGTSPQLTSDGAGHWTLATTATVPDGTYSVVVHTADAAGNVANLTAANALTVDTLAPAAPTVNPLVTNRSQPVLTGTWDQTTPGGATVLQVTVAGTTYTLGSSSPLTSDGSGHWTLTTNATIPDGSYSVSIHTADAAGNVANLVAANALTINTTPVTPTVQPLTTTNTTPTLTGTADPINAALLQVTISNSAASYSATYTLGTSPQLSASAGNWTLNLNGTTPLAVGTYTVTVHTANAAGKSADSTAGSLVISSTAPVVAALSPQSANIGVPVNISAAITGGNTTGLSASIKWGDGTTTAGTFATVNGVLTVSGSHAYSTAATFNIQLTVTNAAGLSASVATTAAITPVATTADLQVTAGATVKIVGTNVTAAYDFDARFVSGGLRLTGVNGTTFNGAATLFIANATSLSGQLSNGGDSVRISGQGADVSLVLGTGQNTVTFNNFVGGKAQVTSAGALTARGINSTLSSLTLNGGAAADLFHAANLRVTGNTVLNLGDGANTVRIDDSHFNNVTLNSIGAGTVVRIEAGQSDGTGTQFDGAVAFQVAGGAQIFFSSDAQADRTTFGGSLSITATSPNALLHLQNVTFAHRPALKNVTIVIHHGDQQGYGSQGNGHGEHG